MDDPSRLLLLVFIKVVQVLTAKEIQSKDYCMFESFHPNCGKNEAVLISHAKYGRMRASDCAPEGFGSKPSCVIDIRPYIDSLCSGRQQCQFEIPDKTMKSFNKPAACKKGLELFLEAGYECVKVQNTREERCYPSSQNAIDAHGPGLIASYVTYEENVGSVSCPWIIRAHPGQRINLTLWDFSTPYTNSKYYHHPNEVLKPTLTGCHRKYAQVRESGFAGQTICGGVNRKHVVYTSHSNKVTLVMEQQRRHVNKSYFFIQYQAVGCSDLQAPVHGWVNRQGNRISMGCNNTQEKWHMICDGTNWVGQTKNCSSHEAAATESMWFVFHDNNWSSPTGILLVAFLGVALGLLFGIALLSIVILVIKRRRSKCFYGDNPYEEAKYSCDREAHYFIPNPVHEKRRTSQSEQIEMTSPVHTHAHGDVQYGTMSVRGTTGLPAYTPPLGRNSFAGVTAQRMADRGRPVVTVDPRSPGTVDKCEHHYSR